MEQLKEALLKTYTWKGPKQKVNGETTQTITKLVDASQEELQQFFQYCNLMLHNTSKNKPGRYSVLCIIIDQINRCNAELLIRWFRNEKIDQVSLLTAIKEFIANNKEILGPKEKLIANDIANNIPKVFSNVPVNLLEDACLDILGKFNKKHITLSFIAKQGIALNLKEQNDFSKNTTISCSEQIKQECSLPTNIELCFKQKGFTYSEFKTLINIKNDKYSSMSSDQLKLLSNKLLPSLEKEINKHITFWESQKDKILQVANSKGWTW